MMMTKVAIISKTWKKKSVMSIGIIVSIMSMSDENLFNILPTGLVSKKLKGLLITDFSKVSCKYFATVVHFQ